MTGRVSSARGDDHPPLGEVSLAVLAATNHARRALGLAALHHDRRLWRSAHDYAVEMAATGVFEHGAWSGRIRAAGFDGAGIGENIAVGQPDAAEVVADWLASPGHRRNMLDPDYVAIGVSWATDDEGRRYWVQDFGSR